jgi:hypothetical protein
MMPFILASKTKYRGTNLMKDVKDFSTENCKALQRKIKDDPKRYVQNL